MFGYIRPFQPELKVKELDAYKAVYCGLCGQLGKAFGPAARLTLSYDFAFLSMLAYGVSGETPSVRRRRCYVNPLKQMPVCEGDKALCIGADAAAIMLYYKALDNRQDGGFFSGVGWSLLQPVAGHGFRAAGKRQPEMASLIGECIARQQEVEAAQNPEIDPACEPTAQMLGGMFQQLSEDERQQRALQRLGYVMGRYVYLCDALDDMERDVAKNNYNPLALRHGLARERGDWVGARQEAAESLYMTIGEAEKTFLLLSLTDFSPILHNIVSMGLRASVDAILAQKETDK